MPAPPSCCMHAHPEPRVNCGLCTSPTEGAVASRKQALSQAKERYEADRTEVAQLIEATTANYDVYAAALADARDLLADVRRAEADLAATQDQPRALLSLTLQEARGVLDEQVPCVHTRSR